MNKRTVTLEEYLTEAEKLFGPDKKQWKFICPGCGHIASVHDYENAGAPEGAIGFSCIGRFLNHCRDWLSGSGPGPCNYTQGGLFGISPVKVVIDDEKNYYIFEFAPNSDTG